MDVYWSLPMRARRLPAKVTSWTLDVSTRSTLAPRLHCEIHRILTSRTEGKEGLGVRPKEESEVKSRVIDDTMWCLLRDKSKCERDMGERENVLISTTKSKQNRWAEFGNKGTWNPFKLKHTLTQKSAHEYKERLSPVCLVSLLRKEEVKKSPF